MKLEDLTPAQLAYIRDHYPVERSQDVAAAMNLSLWNVNRMAKAMGLKKDPAVFTHCQRRQKTESRSRTASSGAGGYS